MKKIFALLFALVASFGLLTSCELNQKTPTEPVEPTEPTVEEISQDLKNAKNYVKNIYQATEGKVTANMDRAAKVPVGTSKSAKVDWAVEVTSGDANAVSVQKAEDGSKWVVNVKYDNTITAEVKFVLTATITLEDGESTTISFNYTIPVFEANTIAEMIKEADKEKIYFLEGVITAVNKTEGNTAFIITDATGSIFCYDGLEVKLGQKVQITGNYSAYNDAFHQLAKPALVKVLAENQDLATVCGTPLVTTAQAINEAAKAEGATAVSLTEAYGGKFLEVTGYVVNANGYANLAVAADVASCCNLYANDDLNLKSFIGAKVVVKGYARGVSVGNGITIQLQSVELAPGESMPTPPAAEIEEPAVTNKTLAEIIAMDDANNLKAAYKVTATVSKLGQKEDQTVAGAYGNLWVGEGDEKILVYGATATASALAWDKTTGTYVYTNAKDFDTNEFTKDIKVGDELELLAVRSAYKGTPQLMVIVLKVNGVAHTPVETPETPEKPTLPTEPTTTSTITEVLATAEGTVVKVELEIKTIKDTAKGNFVLTDGTNTIEVYGLSDKNGVAYGSWTSGNDFAIGDTIVIYGTRSSFTGSWAGAPTIDQIQNAVFVSIEKKPVDASKIASYLFSKAMPTGLTSSASSPAFYGDGGYKFNSNSAVITLTTAAFEAQSSIKVNLIVNALNAKKTEAGEVTTTFTVCGLDASGNVVATQTIASNAVVAGDNVVTLTGTGIVKVTVAFNDFPSNADGFLCNVSLGGIVINKVVAE